MEHRELLLLLLLLLLLYCRLPVLLLPLSLLHQGGSSEGAHQAAPELLLLLLPLLLPLAPNMMATLPAPRRSQAGRGRPRPARHNTPWPECCTGAVLIAPSRPSRGRIIRGAGSTSPGGANGRAEGTKDPSCSGTSVAWTGWLGEACMVVRAPGGSVSALERRRG